MSDALVFRQSMSIGLRWFLAGAGLFCFFPTYDLLIRPGVPVLVLGMVPMWIISLAAGALGSALAGRRHPRPGAHRDLRSCGT